MSEQCRSCGARVMWVKTSKGKKMPLDAEPVANGNLVMATLPDAIAVSYDPTQHGGLSRFTSHFATCPQSAAWRKR